MITAKRVNKKVSFGHDDRVQNPIKQQYVTSSGTHVIEGAFYDKSPVLTVREMVTRRINKSLCFCLMVTISITFISYYIEMNYEAKLNALDAEIVRINAENQDLQAELDKYKSFNNIDNKIGKFNLLQKADKVIEVTALTSSEVERNKAENNSKDFKWALGY